MFFPILASYWVRYPHTMSFLRNKTLHPLCKPSEPHIVQEMVSLENLKIWKKLGVKTQDCALLINFFAHFLIYLTHAVFSRVSPTYLSYFFKLLGTGALELISNK